MKLTEGQTKALTQVGIKGWSFVGQLTNPSLNEIHGPSAARLAVAGLIDIHKPGNGAAAATMTEEDKLKAAKLRVALISTAGRTALGTSLPATASKPNGASKAKPKAESKREMAPEGDPDAPLAWTVIGVVHRGKVRDYAVVSTRPIRRGRNSGCVAVKLAPMERLPEDKFYAMNGKYRPGKGAEYFQAPEKRWTMADMKAAINACGETKKKVQDAKNEHAANGEGRIHDMYILVDDLVTVNYKDVGERPETVVDVNRNTGKVAIASKRNKSGKRWIHASQITKCESPRRSLPIILSEREGKELEDKGAVQAKRGSEFIERSYSVAKTKQDALLSGTNYDGASQVVNFDTERELYWRFTGSFD